MIVSTKIAKMFKHCGFVNIDYLVENKLERNPSKILNSINRDWRKWVKPVCMKPNPKTLDPFDPNFGHETIETATIISDMTGENIRGTVFTITETGTADSITVALKRGSAGSNNVKCAIYLHSDLSLVAQTASTSTSLTTTLAWYTFDLTTSPTLTANTEYILVVWADYTTSNIYGAAHMGATNQGHGQYKVYNDFPNPLVPTHSNFEYSIYCTYSTGAPPPSAGILVQVI